jgi:hypothetical protein
MILLLFSSIHRHWDRYIVDIREVLDAIFYRTRTGCQWRMLPSHFPAWYHVWYYFRTWRDDGTCGVCGMLFTGREGMKYCSERCKHKASYLRQQQSSANS